MRHLPKIFSFKSDTQLSLPLEQKKILTINPIVKPKDGFPTSLNSQDLGRIQSQEQPDLFYVSSCVSQNQQRISTPLILKILWPILVILAILYVSLGIDMAVRFIKKTVKKSKKTGALNNNSV